MSSPYYVSPEQIIQDKRDLAQRGIEQAKEVIALEYNSGIVLVAENPLTTVFKISEVYDRIALAATGLSPEYEALRLYGIEQAEIKGFTYNREDVTAKWLTTVYSQRIGAIFREWDVKPLEVELLVCEVKGDSSSNNRIYHLSFDGTFGEEEQYAVIGGRADSIVEILEQEHREGMSLEDAIRLGIKVFETIEEDVDEENSEDPRYEIAADTIEVALLEEEQARRRFRRLLPEELEKFF
ncbi:MAG: proteasome subunit alpha [Candidatus Poribacteria bacterium]|nr:proteasome subunit alpha [Candidatus Poribacteria bacterium]